MIDSAINIGVYYIIGLSSILSFVFVCIGVMQVLESYKSKEDWIKIIAMFGVSFCFFLLATLMIINF